MSVCRTLAPRFSPATTIDVSFTSIEAGILEGAGNALGGSTDIRSALAKFAKCAKELQMLLTDGCEVHEFISCTSTSNTAEDRDVSELFTIVSNLFHKALRSNEISRNVTTQALRDLFFIAYRAVGNDGNNDLTSVLEPQAVLSIVPFSLPHWFPCNRAKVPSSQNPEPRKRPTYSFCREGVVSSIMKLDTTKLATLYARFFKSWWEKGQTLQLVSNSMVYAKLTPLYLREPVLFMYGPQRSRSLPFLLRTLPNKNQIREKNGKILGAVILDVLMKKEPSSGMLLESMLGEENVEVANDHDSSSSVIDMTRNQTNSEHNNQTASDNNRCLHQPLEHELNAVNTSNSLRDASQIANDTSTLVEKRSCQQVTSNTDK